MPYEVTRQQITLEIDQTLQHLPDFSDQVNLSRNETSTFPFVFSVEKNG
jgi:hypothetical protein